MKKQPVRLQDVADRAAVSLATASRVLNSPGAYRGRLPLRKRVLAAAAELGYEPNVLARALASSRTSTLGLVVHDVGDAYFGLLTSSIIQAADSHGLLAIMVCSYRDPARELKYVKALRSQRPSAIIMAATGYSQRTHQAPIDEELTKYQEDGGVVVSISGSRGIGHRIAVGNYEGARMLAHSLVELGHRRFGIAVGTGGLLAVRERVEGFRTGLREHEIEVRKDHMFGGESTYEGGIAVADAIARSSEPPTCVFGAFDVVAAGVMAGLQRHGLRVPEDVSVAGFADVPLAAQITPSLTTVSLPLDLVGRQAVDLAISSADIRRTVAFDGTVVLRQSTSRLDG